MSGRGSENRSGGARRGPGPASNSSRSSGPSYPSDEAIIHDMIGEFPSAEIISTYVERFKHSPELRRLATSVYGVAKSSIRASSNLNTSADKVALHAALNVLRLKRALLEYPDLIHEFPVKQDLNRVVEAHRRRYGNVLSSVERGQSSGLNGLSARGPEEVASIRRAVERLVSKESSESDIQGFHQACLDDEELLEAVKQELVFRSRSNVQANVDNAALALHNLTMQEFDRDEWGPGHGASGRRTNRQQPHRPATASTASSARRETRTVAATRSIASRAEGET